MKLEDVPKYYDHAARKYDRRLRFWFGRVLRLSRHRERAVSALGPLDGATVLDVGCGTGANLPLLVPRVGPRGRVLGVDYSEGMLARARQKVEERGWTNVELRRGDAAKLDVVDEPVDAAISTYCLGIVHDLEGALHRIVELLRPGGVLAVLDFERTRPDRGPLRWLHPLYRRYLVAAGIDSPRDLDDEALRERWARGKAVLRAELDDVREDDFLFGAGLWLRGVKPASAGT